MTLANGYMRVLRSAEGEEYRAVANPVKVTGYEPAPAPAPQHGQHTEEVLLALGYSWEDIAALKDSGAVL